MHADFAIACFCHFALVPSTLRVLRVDAIALAQAVRPLGLSSRRRLVVQISCAPMPGASAKGRFAKRPISMHPKREAMAVLEMSAFLVSLTHSE